jgi:hypothetical protein
MKKKRKRKKIKRDKNLIAVQKLLGEVRTFQWIPPAWNTHILCYANLSKFKKNERIVHGA